MKCDKCGTVNDINSKFCKGCGNLLVINSEVSNLRKEKENCKLIGIIGLISSFLIGFLAMPLNIIAIVKGKKIKKKTNETEAGFVLGLVGLILNVFILLVFIIAIVLMMGIKPLKIDMDDFDDYYDEDEVVNKEELENPYEEYGNVNIYENEM